MTGRYKGAKGALGVAEDLGMATGRSWWPVRRVRQG